MTVMYEHLGDIWIIIFVNEKEANKCIDGINLEFSYDFWW